MVRIAIAFHVLPHEIWALPFSYYRTLRDDFVELHNGPEEPKAKLDDRPLTPDRLDELAEQGVTSIDMDDVLRKRKG